MSRSRDGQFKILSPRAGSDSQENNVISTILGKRSFSAVPQPENTVESINATVVALKERSIVQAREAGSVLDSYTTVRDMVALGVVDASGKTLESRVQDIEDRLAAAGIP